MFGKDHSKEYIEQRPGEYDVTLADYTVAKEVLGWKPIKDLETHIKLVMGV